MDKDFQDIIDNFLLHPDSMPTEEKQQLMQELQQQPEKREQFLFTQTVMEAVSRREEKLKFLRELQRKKQQLRYPPIAGCACLAPMDSRTKHRQATEKAQRTDPTPKPTKKENNGGLKKKLKWGGGIAAAVNMGMLGMHYFMADKAAAPSEACPFDNNGTPEQPDRPNNIHSKGYHIQEAEVNELQLKEPDITNDYDSLTADPDLPEKHDQTDE